MCYKKLNLFFYVIGRTVQNQFNPGILVKNLFELQKLNYLTHAHIIQKSLSS